MSNPIISAKKLSYTLEGHNILQDLTFTIHRGDYLGLIGPNGGGKTTLARLILDLIRPNSGELLVHTTAIGYVPQQFDIELVTVPISVREILASKSRDLDPQTLDILELKPLLAKKFQDLSGGQKQKVLFARALLGQPEMLILDEPFSAIDDPSRYQIQKLLKTLNDGGLTIIVISHDLDMVTAETTSVFCLNRGLHAACHPRDLHGNKDLEKVFGGSLKSIHHHTH